MQVATIQVDERVSRFVTTPRKLLINGTWREAASGKTFQTFTPATGDGGRGCGRRPGRYLRGRQRGANRVRCRPWRRMTTSERGRLIWRLADLLEEHLDEFANLSRSTAKPAVARAADVPLAMTCFGAWQGGPRRSKATIPSRCHAPGSKFFAYAA